MVSVKEKAEHDFVRGSKGYYRLAKTKAVQLGINNEWLKAQGLVSIKEQWVKVPLSKWRMNRPVRSRMQGGVGRAGEKLALTRLAFGLPIFINM